MSLQTLTTRWVDIPVSEAMAPGDRPQPMEGFLALPSRPGPHPAVLVLMEIFGVNDHIRAVTERVAAAGYAALAINYYHRTTPNMNLGYTAEDVVEGRRHKDLTTREGLLADARAALGFLHTLPEVRKPTPGQPARVGSIGFCFGGHVAYLLATLPELAATVSFYGAGIATTTPGNGGRTIDLTPEIAAHGGSVLCFFGEQDPLIPVAQTHAIEKALCDAGVPGQVIRYPDAGHGFFCDQRADFRPVEANDAWSRVKAFWQQTLAAS